MVKRLAVVGGWVSSGREGGGGGEGNSGEGWSTR
jgi:hypothetical protein